MTDETDDRLLARLLDGVYAAQERATRDEIQRRAVAMDLPADLRARLDALPEGEYALDEAAEALGADGAL